MSYDLGTPSALALASPALTTPMARYIYDCISFLPEKTPDMLKALNEVAIALIANPPTPWEFSSNREWRYTDFEY